MIGKFEMSETGSFRIAVLDAIANEVKVSDPAPYTGIAHVKLGKRMFIAVSQYWEGTLPTEVILEVKQDVVAQFTVAHNVPKFIQEVLGA